LCPSRTGVPSLTRRPPPRSPLFPYTTLFRSFVLSEADDEQPAQIAYYPDAFSPGSQRVLRRLFPDAVLADAADAECFGLNAVSRSEEHTSELQSRENIVCRPLLEKKEPRSSP